MTLPYTFLISLHVLGFAGCFGGSLTKTITLLSPVQDARRLRRLRRLDKLTGASTALIIVTGLTLLFWAAKPTEIYTASPVFWVKMALFATISALVLATKGPLKRAQAPWSPPARLRWFLRGDLAGLPLLALMGLYLAYIL